GRCDICPGCPSRNIGHASSGCCKHAGGPASSQTLSDQEQVDALRACLIVYLLISNTIIHSACISTGGLPCDPQWS
ncbi:hypothetical protein BS17DRAFT_732289, partial [Gyrodon lividus]